MHVRLRGITVIFEPVFSCAPSEDVGEDGLGPVDRVTSGVGSRARRGDVDEELLGAEASVIGSGRPLAVFLGRVVGPSLPSFLFTNMAVCTSSETSSSSGAFPEFTKSSLCRTMSPNSWR